MKTRKLPALALAAALFTLPAADALGSAINYKNGDVNFDGDVSAGDLTALARQVSALNITDSVKSVSNNAFLGCTGLTSVVMADSVINIGISAFSNCTNLTSVTIPDSVMNIGSCAFEDCTKLTSITYTGTKAQWNSIIKGGSWDYNTGKYVVHCKDGNISK